MPNIHELVPHNFNKDIFIRENIVKSDYCSAHWHYDLEVIYVLEGAVEFMLGEKMVQISKGNFIIIPPKQIHSTLSLNGNHSIIFQISYEFLNRYISSVDILDFYNSTNIPPEKGDINKEVKKCIKHLLNVFVKKEKYYELIFHEYLFHFLTLMMNHYSYNNKDKVVKTDKDFERLSCALQYMKDHYNQQLTLGDIADTLSLNEAYLCRYFKKHIGIAPMKYMNSIRIEHIYTDLLSTNDNLYELLEKHGFYNYKVFRKMFYDTFHTTPGNLRKNAM